MFDAKENTLPTVYLGNSSALDAGRPIAGTQVTQVVFMDEDGLVCRMRTLTHEDGIWIRHSTAKPAWVESDDAELEATIADYYDCPIGRPVDWYDSEGTK